MSEEELELNLGFKVIKNANGEFFVKAFPARFQGPPGLPDRAAIIASHIAPKLTVKNQYGENTFVVAGGYEPLAKFLERLVS